LVSLAPADLPSPVLALVHAVLHAGCSLPTATGCVANPDAGRCSHGNEQVGFPVNLNKHPPCYPLHPRHLTYDFWMQHSIALHIRVLQQTPAGVLCGAYPGPATHWFAAVGPIDKWMLHRHRPLKEPTKGSLGTAYLSLDWAQHILALLALSGLEKKKGKHYQYGSCCTVVADC
jgi:hypothetical protein